MVKDLTPYMSVYPLRILAIVVLIPLGIAVSAADCMTDARAQGHVVSSTNAS